MCETAQRGILEVSKTISDGGREQTMSLAHYFENEPQAGFAPPNMAQFARRQLQMSLGLVVILALAALFIALANGGLVKAPKIANPALSTQDQGNARIVSVVAGPLKG